MKKICFIIILILTVSGCKANDFYQFIYNGKYGFINNNYEIVIKPEFDYATDFSNGFAVVKKNSNYILINREGEFVKTLGYEKVFLIEDNYIYFTNDGLYGIATLDGDIIIKDCERVNPFNEGLSAVEIKKQKWNYIDKNGKIIFTNNFKYAESFSEGLAAVRDPQTNKWGFINKAGFYIITPVYDSVLPIGKFEYGHCIVSKDKTLLVIDKKNNIISKLNETIAFIADDNVIAAGTSNILFGNYKLVKFNGDIIKESFAHIIKRFNNGLAFFKSIDNNKWGIIDNKGNFLTEPIFSDPSDFNNGLAFIKIDDDYGFINTSGEITLIKDIVK